MAPVTPKARVFIVDDHPIMRIGLAEVIGSEPDLEVCISSSVRSSGCWSSAEARG